ncbi:MAG: hypothetical protein GX640_13190 [Fibrobacter sp.]|nr:hypothetical protein [Fibrobacter sp.]
MKLLFLLPLGLLFCCNQLNQSSNLKKAADAEVTGKFDVALATYGDILLKVTPATDIPNVNRSKILDALTWKKELEKYTIFLGTKPQNLSKEYPVILEGLSRCSNHVTPDNFMTSIKQTPYTEENYRADWYKAFFAPSVTVDSNQISLISANFMRNMSFVKINSGKNYTYDLWLINKATGVRQNAVLYPENSVQFLASPGEYLLLCKGMVKFPSGGIWRSNYTLFTLNIPEKTSVLSAGVYTKVAREK